MPKQNAKKKRGDAERAAEWYARAIHKCVITRKAIRTQWQSVDFFASDIIGKKADGSHVYIQATAGQNSAVTARRRKLEKIPWHESDTVELVQLIQTEDPANARRKLWFFRVHYYHKLIEPDPIRRKWKTKDEAVPIPKKWFKKYKEGEE